METLRGIELFAANLSRKKNPTFPQDIYRFTWDIKPQEVTCLQKKNYNSTLEVVEKGRVDSTFSFPVALIFDAWWKPFTQPGLTYQF